MPPSSKPSPAKNKKVIIIAVLGLLVVGYFFLRSKSATTAAPGATAANGSPIPQTASDAAQQSTDQSSADLLAALAGENSQLMKSFLASSSGLVSLAGSSVGSPSSSTGAGEPSGFSGFASTTSDPFTDFSQPFDTSTPSITDSNPIASSLTAPTAPSAPAAAFVPAATQVAATASRPVGSVDYSPTSPFGVSPYSPATIASLSAPLDLSNVQSQDYSPNEPFGVASGPTVTSPIIPGPNLGLGAVPNSKPGSGNLAA